MPVTIESSLFGMPVEIGQISRELKKLWDRDSEVSTRASLVNFAVYCEGARAMEENTALIMELTREHACRALLIGYEPDSAESRVRAWINAHCHLSRAGAKQVCCEQITFLFEGATCDRVPNILFSNLDSDLPLYLLWQGEFHEPIDEQLWAWVDRLIFDSQAWAEPRRQFALLDESLVRARSRLTLCDLNWTRSLHIRQALSQMFDHPANLAILDQLDEVAVRYAPGYRSTALLLAGWLAAQLKLTLEERDGSELQFRNSAGEPIHFHLESAPGRSLSLCHLRGGGGHVDIERDDAGDFFRVDVRLPTAQVYHHLLPAGSNSTTSLLLEEIGSGGQHRVYLKALSAAQSLW